MKKAIQKLERSMRAWEETTVSRNRAFLVWAATAWAVVWCAGRAEAAEPASRDSKGTWTPTGNLVARSYAATAMLLPDGHVLLAGRAGSSGTTNSQLYDLAAGTWTITAPLNQTRGGNTLTPLANGKALAAGGFGSKHCLASAELFDPASRTWKYTGAMNFARFKHTATMLPDGNVLVAGNYNGTNDCLHMVRYSPDGRTGERAVARLDTPESNGEDQAKGDHGGRTDSSSAELYEPASETWNRTGSLNHARGDHTATLLRNGMVLVAGGFDPQGRALSSAELYVPASGSWMEVGGLKVARAKQTATLLLDGKVLVVGGQDGKGGYLREAELFDPVSQTWTVTQPMLFDRSHHTATLLENGKVLVAGGYCISGPTAVTEIYDPEGGTWTRGMMKGARFWHTATLLPDGRVLVAGGAAPGLSDPLSTAELFDASSRAR